MADLKLKPEVTPQVGKLLIARRKELLRDLAELERDCFEQVNPPTDEQIDAVARSLGISYGGREFDIRSIARAVACGVAGNDYHTNCHEPLMKDDPT